MVIAYFLEHITHVLFILLTRTCANYSRAGSVGSKIARPVAFVGSSLCGVINTQFELICKMVASVSLD